LLDGWEVQGTNVGVCDDGVGGGRERGEDCRDEMRDQVEAAVDSVLMEDTINMGKDVAQTLAWVEVEEMGRESSERRRKRAKDERDFEDVRLIRDGGRHVLSTTCSQKEEV